MGDEGNDAPSVSQPSDHRLPFYKRTITPRWLPAWLVFCLLFGLTGVGIVEYVFGGGSWQRRCLAFSLGFFLALIGLSWDMPAESGSEWVPPKWLRMPVIALAFLLWLYDWMQKHF